MSFQMDRRIPEQMQTMLAQQYTEEECARIQDGFLSERITTLRVNRLKATGEEVRALLDTAGVPWQSVPWYEDALCLPAGSETLLKTLPMYTEGKIYIQGLSAMLPALLLAPRAGESILDMAAAPGGKTTQIAALSADKASVTACERDARRAERLKYNIRTQGMSKVTVMNQDARQLDDMFRFDKILLDAPCTGSGTLKLNTEMPRRMENDWIRRIVRTQQNMLDKALRLLKKGGLLVYSTCSILRQENEDNVDRILNKNNVSLVPVPDELVRSIPGLSVTIPGTYCVQPSREFEGFFVACLQKK